MRILGALFLIASLVACVQRPIEQIALADVALKAAQKSKADILAPDAYRKAENLYLRAKKDFSEGYFDSARKYADQARVAAEQSEYQALEKQNKVSRPPSTDETPLDSEVEYPAEDIK